MKKSQIRKLFLKIRKRNSNRNISINFQDILNILIKKKIKAKVIGGYYPYNYELDCLEILKRFEKKNYVITLPKIRENFKMSFFEWSSKDPFSINKYGIPEPISKRIRYPDILLVPLLAFDKNLNRVGYGGGFYDRYIKRMKNRKKSISIGLAYSFQKVREIKSNKNDMKLDFVITEKKIFI